MTLTFLAFDQDLNARHPAYPALIRSRLMQRAQNTVDTGFDHAYTVSSRGHIVLRVEI